MKYILSLCFSLCFTTALFAQARFEVRLQTIDAVAFQMGAAEASRYESREAMEDKICQLFARHWKEESIYLFCEAENSSNRKSADTKFEEKYEVQYYTFGRTTPSEETIKTYNFRTFAWLRQQYGKKWRRKIRKDVIGYKEWKRNRKLREEYLKQ